VNPVTLFTPEITYIKLSDLTKRIRQVLNETFGDQTYWIIAEISGHKFYPDRDRHYFDLVEKIDNSATETAKVKANSWEQGSQKIAVFESITGQRFQDGLQVLACVRVNYHIVYGLSLTLVDVDPNFTLGNLERLRRETLQRLVTDNPDCITLSGDQYITRNKQLELNCVLQRIALIGSPKSEGYTDFVHTIENNQYGYRLTIDFYYSSVQGIAAEQELVKTLIQVYEKGKTRAYDCVVITRGGGARTDFLVFDTYSLARVIARFPIPVITGIGHHKDVSIVDLMAHTQTKTPTKAAEFILAHNRSFEEDLLRHQRRVVIKTQQLLTGHTRKINQVQYTLSQVLPSFLNQNREQLAYASQVVRHKPVTLIVSKQHALLKTQQAVINCSKDILHKQSDKLTNLLHRLSGKPREITSFHQAELVSALKFIRFYSERLLANQKQFLDHQLSIMAMMSPKNILRKGFAIISRGEQIITNPGDVSKGDPLTITLHDTDIHTTVTSKTESHGKYDV
jgi:exodeoxyribonuclease VII large subunit